MIDTIITALVTGGTSIVVTAVTKSGFTTTGSGSFNYMAQIG